jgi:hypothetical protein
MIKRIKKSMITIKMWRKELKKLEQPQIKESFEP